MDLFDVINASFEAAAGIAVLNNCYTVIKDKAVKGVSVSTIAFFTLWGAWNIIYYPYLGQTFSFLCGVFVFQANILYVILLAYYKRRENAKRKNRHSI